MRVLVRVRVCGEGKYHYNRYVQFARISTTHLMFTNAAIVIWYDIWIVGWYEETIQ